MQAFPALNEWIAILPEIILVTMAILILLWDAFRDEGSSSSEPLAWLAGIGTLAALIALFPASNSVQGPVLGGMVLGDGFGVFLRAVLFAGVFLVLLSGKEYISRFRVPGGEFYALLLTAAAGGGLMAASANLLMFYLGLELLSFCSYVLIGLRTDEARSNEAALKYFLNSILASAILLFGLSWLYGMTGTLEMLQIADGLAATSFHPAWVVTTLVLIVAGFGFKLASVPFHLWAPDVYQGAPTPVTAFLSVGSKGAAMAAGLRLFYFGLGPIAGEWTLYWALIGAVTMTWGNLSALHQTNIKRLFGYSSIAQAGYLLVGLAAGSEGGMFAAMFYLLAYTFTNLGAFAVITAVSNAGGTEEIAGYSGLIRRSPFLAVAMSIFFLSLIGMPFTAGFFGKFYLIGAAVGAGLIWMAVFVAINSVISVGYYFQVVRNMFLREADEDLPAFRPGFALQSAVVIALIGTLGIGIMPQFVGWAQAAALLP